VAERSAEYWYPTAAYLYVLHLDAPALAWEYLRRNPDYRRDWLRRQRRPDAAHQWGLRLLENPELDARDAHPAWLPGHDGVLQLVPDVDPPPDAVTFAFWQLPGHKQLLHDGKRLMLMADWPGNCLRFALAPDLEDGMAFAYAVRAGTAATSLRQLANTITTTARPQPSRIPDQPPPRCWNCTPCRRLTRPSRVRPCAKSPKGCSALMLWPQIGKPMGICAPACGAWFAVAAR